MDLIAQRRLLVAAALLLAVIMGWQLAHRDFLLPGLLFALGLPLLAGRLSGIPAAPFFGGLLLAGYLIGNRGFAQLGIPGFPLLPGEAVLGFGVLLALWQGAAVRARLIRPDALNLLLLTWIVLCTLRLPQDVRAQGFVAVRDFALVYYALFFFLARWWAETEPARRHLSRCLTLGFALGPPVALAFDLWPEVFARFTVAGVPLIFVKGDVAAAFMAAGACWFARRFVVRSDLFSAAAAAACAASAAFSNSRAALVALVVGAGAVLALRERRIARLLLLGGGLAAGALALEAAWPREPGRESRLFRLYESARTVADFGGTRTPDTADLGDKPDNNRFRLIWWEAVVDQTSAEAPWFGLGFGHDLAAQFVRRYYPDSADDFNTRSPHNFLVTLYGRTGALGLLLFAAILAACVRETWRASRRHPDTGAVACWLAPGMIFIAACFGVVLEGPMGAVVFWTLLGLAHHTATETVAAAPDSTAEEATPGPTGAIPAAPPSTAPALPAPAAAAEVRALPDPLLRFPPAAPPSPSA